MVSDGIEIDTPWVKLKGTGLISIMLILTAGSIGYTAFTASQVSHEHRLIVTGMNDLFLATVLSTEQKQNLPYFVQEKVKEKVEEKTKRKLQAE